MENKKGFTLIELLAIIVILAIIAVITVPIILEIIENSKVGAATDSAYGYKDAINKWYVSKLQEDSNYTLNGDYNIEDGKIDGIEIPLSGDKPTSGYLSYNNNVLTEGCLTIGDYAVTFEDGKVSNTQKGSCEKTPLQSVYYTYDRGNMSDISDSVDPSWDIWVRMTKELSGYVLSGTINGENVYRFIFPSEDKCFEALSSMSSEEIEEYNPKCEKVGANEVFRVYYKDGGLDDNFYFSSKQQCEQFRQNEYSYEYDDVYCDTMQSIDNYAICGKTNDKSFCLKKDDYYNNVDVLEGVFESEECSIADRLYYGSQFYHCGNSDIFVNVSVAGHVTINNYLTEILFSDDGVPMGKDGK